MDRRQFISALVAAAASPPGGARATSRAGFGPLRPDPGRILDLPEGFRYDIVARHGDEMDDGLLVPARPDGMAAFAGGDSQVVLVCNYENAASAVGSGPFGAGLERLPRSAAATVYDDGRGKTPGSGGTATLVWDAAARRRVRQHMSLIGTELNCAGGSTPWGSWLSCEECFTDPGTSFEGGTVVSRSRRHGYVFEVPSGRSDAVSPQPLTAMGRFEHEAAAVDPATGIVYLTEDRYRSLLYRFLPQVPGKLASGGRLQALAVAGRPQFDTRNWGVTRDIEPGQSLPVTWVDLPEPDVDVNDLRFRGHAAGAARFARGEGLCYADGEFIMTCTIGGSERLGQVFALRPDLRRGDTLRLVAESTQDSLLRHADNIAAAPWGDLVVCEDTSDHCGLVGLRPDGVQYPIADNAYSTSELAGVCFSPGGDELYVNIQNRGLTLAVRGPWERRAG